MIDLSLDGVSRVSPRMDRSLNCFVCCCAGILCLAFTLVSGSVAASPLDDSAERYRPYMVEGIGQALNGARDLKQRIAESDLVGAKKAWLSARAGWERSEVFTAGFVPELDQKIDAWPDATTGFHAIEAKLFGSGKLDVGNEADALVGNLDDLHSKLHGMELKPQGLLDGLVRLAYEVGESKADGGESRISGTSLDDMRNNVSGIDFAYRTIFATALEASDRKLADKIDQKIKSLSELMGVRELRAVNIPKLREVSEDLVVSLQAAAPKLGLGRPTLEASTR
ncbi:EfeM/EfeO family lipoprotein [Bradyrhizobium sp. SYSU BS000235]|uniref:EfeM/EfeO family lipoprotein n=1 Tax=Bradyrhizobium sp. SYSU BS000235 TaxID=3411332 RepID=UPI003C72A01E